MLNQMGSDIYPLSLAGAVRYAHAATGIPVFVTEHGMAHRDDSYRAAFLDPALRGLLDAIEVGVPVVGYLHWTLLDNFEWIFGYDFQLGLHEVDRQTFVRKPKPSAAVYSVIARANAVSLEGRLEVLQRTLMPIQDSATKVVTLANMFRWLAACR